MIRRIQAIDSHTGGEPTRVIIAGGPDLGKGSMAERLECFRIRFDAFRSAVVNEPRGSDVLVGALLCDPADASCDAGVIFFNNVGYLGMCGHGTIGLMATLSHLGKVGSGPQRIETPVGIVEAAWQGNGTASVVNVPSYRKTASVSVEVPGLGRIHGDVAWAGNWFYLVKDHGQVLETPNLSTLTEVANRIRRAVNAQGYPQVDHVELFGPAKSGGDSRNFVLCPGGAYDRSPCGTGTSAKLACLAADGSLAEHEPWIQESIIGSTFRSSFRWIDRDRGVIEPTITGQAFITAEATLLIDDEDPLRHGIASPACQVTEQ